jgi:hypothetical protein
MFALMQQQNKEAEGKAESQSTQMMNMMMTFMTGLTQVMKPQKDEGGQNLMFEMFKLQQKSIEKIAEAMNSNMEKFADQINNKGEAFGPMDILTMMQNSEENGYKKFERLQKTLDDQMDKKIKEQAKLLAALDGGGDTEEKSLTEKLIGGFLPMITQQMNKQYPAQAPNPGAAPSNQAPRRAAPAPRPAPRPGNGQAGPQRIAGPQAKPSPKPEEKPKVEPVRVEKEDLMPTPVKKEEKPEHPDYSPNFDAAPTQTAPKPIPREETPMDAEFTEVETVETAQVDDNLKQKIIDNATPLIGFSLMNGETPDAAAHDHMEKLGQIGISRAQVLENITFEGIIEVARENGIPQIADQWLKDYYASIQNGTRTLGQGVAPESRA